MKTCGWKDGPPGTVKLVGSGTGGGEARRGGKPELG